MTTAQFVSNVYLKSVGKLPTFSSGSTKWLKIVAIGNRFIQQWATEKGVDWKSLYNPGLTLTTVTATDTFAIPTTVLKLSDTETDYVRIFHTDGESYTDYDIVPADRLKEYYAGVDKESSFGNKCAQIGSNLVFNREFVSTDPEFGGTIKAPVYTVPSTISADSDVIPVDNPEWLVVITAAEYVRNDIVRQGQYPNLITEANALMDSMKETNESQIETVIMPWTAPGATWS